MNTNSKLIVEKDFKIQTAEIITVGTEILLGQVLNTNAQFLARKLSDLGINCYFQQSVGDNEKRLIETLKLALSRADLIIITGGLGPTADDISLGVTSKLTNNNLVISETELEKLNKYLDNSGIVDIQNKNLNYKQVYLPEECIILPNDKGTAPGVIMKNKNADLSSGAGNLIILLPGPPKENSYMFENYAEQFIREHSEYVIENVYLKAFGLSESVAFLALKDIAAKQNPSVATYVFPDELIIRVSYKHKRTSNLEELYDTVKIVEDRLGQYIFSKNSYNLIETVFNKLVEKQKTISFAESCTAGLASSKLAEISGASKVLAGGIITYNIDIKTKVLGVPEDILNKHGAVSKETAIAMAKRALELFNSDFSIAITGNAGPSPSEGKEVGLVYISIYNGEKEIVKEFKFTGDRQKIRNKACQSAYYLLLKNFLEEE